MRKKISSEKIPNNSSHLKEHWKPLKKTSLLLNMKILHIDQYLPEEEEEEKYWKF